MKINISGLKNSRQKAVLGRFIKKVCGTVPALKKKGETSFIFLSDKQIRKVNRKFLNHDYATDVISFGYESLPSKKEDRPFGDIYISIEFAKREAKRAGYDAIQELALYSLHGLLHLIGFDDHKPADRKKMFREQTRLFRKLAPNLSPPDSR